MPPLPTPTGGHLETTAVRPATTVLFFLFLAMFAPLLLNGFYNVIITRSPAAYWTVELTVWVLVPWLSLYGYRRAGGEFRDLGVVWPRTAGQAGKDLIYGCIWGFVLLWVFRGGRELGKSVFDENHFAVAFNYGSLIPESGWRETVVWIYFSLSAGIVEELYFRGILRRFFGQGRRAVMLFLAVSTLLFSVIHWENGVNDLLATGAFGLLAGICYVWHRTIFIPVIAHVVADLVLFR